MFVNKVPTARVHEMLEDLSILQRYAQRRDPDAFAELVKRYARVAYSASLRIVGNPADAEDVVQECFLDLAKNAHSVRSSVPGWLHAAATNRAKTAVRGAIRRRRRETMAAGLQAATDTTRWQDIAPLVDQAIFELPAEIRDSVVRHYLQQRTQTEIASDLGVSVSTISRRLEKGLSLLRKELRKNGIGAAVVTLGTLLAENASAALPGELEESLRKIGLAGVSPSSVPIGTGLHGTIWTHGVVTTVVAVTALIATVAVVVTMAFKAKHGATGEPPAPAQSAGRPEAGHQTAMKPAEMELRLVLCRLSGGFIEQQTNGFAPPPLERNSTSGPSPRVLASLAGSTWDAFLAKAVVDGTHGIEWEATRTLSATDRTAARVTIPFTSAPLHYLAKAPDGLFDVTDWTPPDTEVSVTLKEREEGLLLLLTGVRHVPVGRAPFPDAPQLEVGPPITVGQDIEAALALTSPAIVLLDGTRFLPAVQGTTPCLAIGVGAATADNPPNRETQ